MLMSPPADLADYYDRRASEYDEIYARPGEAQERELASMAACLRDHLRGRRVLEIACGTGWWTALAAEVAESVVATDVAPGMLAATRARSLPRVTVLAADAYDLASLPSLLAREAHDQAPRPASPPDPPDLFDAGLSCFWLSHVPLARRPTFLAGFHGRLAPGAAVLLADNVYVEGLGGELVRLPGQEDTFKRRRLADGTEHLVLKNYDSPAALRDLLAPLAAHLDLHVGTRHWWAAYRLP